MTTEPKPTEAALECGEEICIMVCWKQSAAPEIAEIVDRKCQLPQKHVALLLAQGVVDDVGGNSLTASVSRHLIDDLRTALSKIK